MNKSLRIFLCCHQDMGGQPHRIPAYRFWQSYFSKSFVESGHTLLEAPNCDWARGLRPLNKQERHSWSEETWNRTLDYIGQEHARKPIDLFLSYLYPQQTNRQAIEEIRDLQIPVVNFFCDNVREFRRIPKEFHHFDLNWVPEKKALSLYHRDNLPTIYAPMPCWVAPQLRETPQNITSKIAFIGRRDELRARLMADACQDGLNPVIYGPGWLGNEDKTGDVTRPHGNVLNNQWTLIKQHGIKALVSKMRDKLQPLPEIDYDFSATAGKSLDHEAYLKVTRESAVCLGINRFPTPRNSIGHPQTYSRLRDIEAPMVGACYLTEWTEGLDDLFEIGTEIESYRDADELVQKSHALIGNPKRCEAMRTAAQQRALNHHSIARILERICDKLGIT